MHIWASMGVPAKIVAGTLLMMAIAMIGVFVERLITLQKSNKESRAFAKTAVLLIEDWKMQELVQLSEKHQASALARLFSSMTRRYLRGLDDPDGGMTPVELARNEAGRKKDAVGAELRRGMPVLATVGSVAPFVGLLGTVLGIIGAFASIGAAGSGGLGAVSAGISEALIETAFGLAVAIPAVLMFNYLTARVNTIELALERSAGELLDEMENQYGRESSQRSGQAKKSAA
jgi:biopolymer transport protein ExbB